MIQLVDGSMERTSVDFLMQKLAIRVLYIIVNRSEEDHTSSGWNVKG